MNWINSGDQRRIPPRKSLARANPDHWDNLNHGDLAKDSEVNEEGLSFHGGPRTRKLASLSGGASVVRKRLPVSQCPCVSSQSATFSRVSQCRSSR